MANKIAKRLDAMTNTIIAGALTGTKGVGFAAGFVSKTVKDEYGYYVGDKIANTKVVRTFKCGYINGEQTADRLFNNRVVNREIKKEEKRLKKAVNELVNEFDDSVCGDGIWNNKMA